MVRETMVAQPAKSGAGIPLDRNDLVVRGMLAGARVLAAYHQHRVLHLERVGRLLHRDRRVVLVGNHVLDIVDPLLFTANLLERYGVVPHFIGHENLVFRSPLLRPLAERHGMIPSRRTKEAASALRRDGLLMLYPGSGSEAARRVYREEPYRLKWEGRFGFLRLALRYDAEIVFVAAIGIDEMYFQTSARVPRWVLRLFSSERYEGSRWQLGMLGPHVLPGVLPFPVQITHVVSPPLDLGDRQAARRSKSALRELHARVWRQSQNFLDAAVARREKEAPLLDRAIRAGERLLEKAGI